MSDWEIVECCLFGYSGPGPIPDARGALARLRAPEQEHRFCHSFTTPEELTAAIRSEARAEADQARVQELKAALRETAERVHLVLSDHYSGREQERLAAMPAYSWLTVTYEYEDDEHNPQIRDVDGILAALEPRAET